MYKDYILEPLVVIHVSPSDGAVEEETTTAITATFSSPVSDLSINSINFRVESADQIPILGNVTIKDANKTLEFRAQSPLHFGMTYWVTIEGIEQANIVMEKRQWKFNTMSSPVVLKTKEHE